MIALQTREVTASTVLVSPTDYLPRESRDRLEVLAREVDLSSVTGDGLFHSHQSEVATQKQAEADLRADELAHEANGFELPPAQRHEGEKRVAGHRETRGVLERKMRENTARAGALRVLLESAEKYAARLIGPVKSVHVDRHPEKGKTAKATVFGLRIDLTAKHKEAKSVALAPKGVAHDLAVFTDKLDRLAEKPFEVVQIGGAFEVRFPATTVAAEASGGLPVAPDFRPAYIAAHRDELLAEARKTIEGYYDDVPLVIASEADKQNRLRKIADDVLALERRECAIIWAARDEDEVIDFRPDTDVRALLGIEGPSPVVRRRL